MCFGTVPDADVVRCFEISLVLYAEHSFNASTFTAKRRIMGFGHRVYRHGDSRVPFMQTALDRLVTRAADLETSRLATLHAALRQAVLTRKGIHPNLDYPAGLAYHLMGFDTPTFTPIFVMSRITGWTAHITEQLAHNALIRPLASYAGPGERAVPATAG